ncbi:DUF6691 family protein [Oceanicoccus sp. KOV_DT_Chl]|uniref:DUF6691 family protein n=1 Tax=Oceanicoccus sp. KOV_DT_Chl TaxID=1904639 RepID=UPI000C79A862|nr:DUF6691 family protein [Oceanicoccus sp. KOV_DT_Chl]
MELILAIIFGSLFGFVLHRIGAADPDKINGMLQLTDLSLMKTILLAISISSILLFAGLALELIPSAHLSVKKMYSGVLIGGALLGAGWAIAGYCPGTGLVALGSGRIDAIFFVLGGLVGAGIFILNFESLATTAAFNPLLGGEITIAANDKTASLLPVISGFITAALIGSLLIAAAFFIPSKPRE